MPRAANKKEVTGGCKRAEGCSFGACGVVNKPSVVIPWEGLTPDGSLKTILT